jgi:hypothetical protein
MFAIGIKLQYRKTYFSYIQQNTGQFWIGAHQNIWNSKLDIRHTSVAHIETIFILGLLVNNMTDCLHAILHYYTYNDAYKKLFHACDGIYKN